MQNEVEDKLLELFDFCTDAAARIPTKPKVKTCVSCRLNRDTRRMAFHDSIEHAAYSSGVGPSDHEHHGPELVEIAPRRKNLAFTFRSSIGSGNLHDIRYAKPP